MQKYKFLVIYSICEGLFYAKKKSALLKTEHSFAGKQPLLLLG